MFLQQAADRLNGDGRTYDQALHLMDWHPVVQGGNQRTQQVSKQNDGHVGAVLRTSNLNIFMALYMAHCPGHMEAKRVTCSSAAR